MDRVWITNGSTTIPPVVNPLTAACHDGYVPTDIYVLNNPFIDGVTLLTDTGYRNVAAGGVLTP